MTAMQHNQLATDLVEAARDAFRSWYGSRNKSLAIRPFGGGAGCFCDGLEDAALRAAIAAYLRGRASVEQDDDELAMVCGELAAEVERPGERR